MSQLPDGWTKTRVLITGQSNSFTIHLRNPIENVVMATLASCENTNCIIKLDGLNHSYSSAIDPSGNIIHFDYCASNLNTELQFAMFSAPVLPNRVFSRHNYNYLKITLVDAYGALYSLGGNPVNIELDLWSYSG